MVSQILFLPHPLSLCILLHLSIVFLRFFLCFFAEQLSVCTVQFSDVKCMCGGIVAKLFVAGKHIKTDYIRLCGPGCVNVSKFDQIECYEKSFGGDREKERWKKSSMVRWQKKTWEKGKLITMMQHIIVSMFTIHSFSVSFITRTKSRKQVKKKHSVEQLCVLFVAGKSFFSFYTFLISLCYLHMLLLPCPCGSVFVRVSLCTYRFLC